MRSSIYYTTYDIVARISPDDKKLTCFNEALSSIEPHRRVAVIAIHGVADQKPHESARSIVRLLQNLRSAKYSPFGERSLSVPVRPLAPSNPCDEVSGSRIMGGAFHTDAAYKAVVDEGADVALQFITTQIESYTADDPGETYETTRLEGARGATDVHVYEMYWADLSRLSANILHIFEGLYQLLFHIASLAMHTVRAAYIKQHPKSKTWRRLSAAVNGTAFCLAVLLPLINLLMLAFAFTAFATFWLRGHQPLQAVVSLALPALVVAGLLAIFILDRFTTPRWLFFSPLLPSAVAIAFGLSLAPPSVLLALRNPIWYGSVSAICSLVVVAILLKLYQTRRPDYYVARKLPARILAVVLAGLAWGWRLWYLRDTADPVMQSSLNAVELGAAALSVATLILCAFLWASHVLGAYARHSAGDSEEAGSVIWTARLTLTLPSMLFLLSTLGVWAAFMKVIEKPGIRDLACSPLLPWRVKPATVGAFADQVLAGGGTVFYSLMLAFYGIALGLLLWAVLPSAVSETAPRIGTAAGLGAWLNHGFWLMMWAGRLIYFAATVLLPTGVVLALVRAVWRIESLEAAIVYLGETGAFVRWTGSAMLALIAALLAMRGASFGFGGSFRAVLDVLLDVDNYLRELPAENPKARIFARFASLMRFIGSEKYDSVIVIAHSQGSVIAADFLRYVHHARQTDPNYEPFLQPLANRVVLFTMGCPLRQLYGLRFPHLYAWATLAPGTMANLPHDVQPDSRPNPDDAGVSSWVNAYRSGDYVGRSLWRQPDCEYIFAEEKSADGKTPRRREFCIGSGAHTRYWDKDGTRIAQELDRLIRLI